ncbi:hypothetical protein Rsub_06710 [Raphidocelis subcapitata]|uniref:Uncharacterized protein n=1 Tax=Raphidocelis subcapitata TaxID=307507 RepID=A0A2V0PBW9_9CHLO|nr:hypothetical protein Rsub_06710 [Raphidocelis subcapitata]|eukprot:GBF94595.1 hypothetical protein Rsub_06710 [Raphidocelis subcapitata]
MRTMHLLQQQPRAAAAPAAAQRRAGGPPAPRRPGAAPRASAPRARVSVAAAAGVDVPPLPAHLAAELDELEKSAHCGTEGTVLVRPVKEGVPKNGKKYHIHTFGCQVRGGAQPGSWAGHGAAGMHAPPRGVCHLLPRRARAPQHRL